MLVTDQYLHSSQGTLVCSLLMKGIFDLMDDDQANDDFEQQTGAGLTIKDLLDAICNATLSVYDHCTAYTPTHDSADSIFDTYVPSDQFSIAFGESRRSALMRLLEFTKTTARVQSSDDKIHFFQPTVSGPTYDYEYKLAVAGEHTFFAKVFRKRFLIPNYVEVESHPEDGDGYAGTAEDTDYSDLSLTSPFGGEIREHTRKRMASDAEAATHAAARLEKLQQAAEKGSATVPIQVNQEIEDYVNITDSRENNDNRIGNVGFINRQYDWNQQTWKMDFGFGDVRQLGVQWLLKPKGVRTEPVAEEPLSVEEATARSRARAAARREELRLLVPEGTLGEPF